MGGGSERRERARRADQVQITLFWRLDVHMIGTRSGQREGQHVVDVGVRQPPVDVRILEVEVEPEDRE